MKFTQFKRITKLILTLILISPLQSSAQDFMMQGWYWDYPKSCDGNSFADTLNAQAADIGAAGFTYVWLPPLSRASFGSCSVGYDPKDLYDLGEYGLGPTGFGTRTQVDALISSLNANGVDAVADVVYNHRDGGAPEDNPAVRDYITQYMDFGKAPFPSDRFRCIIPIGGTSGNGAGDYYIKISSKTGDSNYTGWEYKVYPQTSIVGWQNLPPITESEPNGGGDCSQGFDEIQLGIDMVATIDDPSTCRTDEFKLTLTAADFDPAGDTLFLYLNNTGGYSDHRIYGIWNASAGADIANQIVYQTFTDFTNMPSGQGAMNWQNFKPNCNGHPDTDKTSTSLGGDWDWLWFFNDYDQYNPNTATVLYDWTNWLWTDVGIRGLRMDAIKHFPPFFVGDLLDDMHAKGHNPGMVVGEFFDGNTTLLNNWVSEVYNNMEASTSAAISVKIFDFNLRFALKDACDSFGYDARYVFNAGIVNGGGGSGFNSVTFVGNHDFREEGQSIENDRMLAYAYILTNNQLGVPCVFYPDYYGIDIPHTTTFYLKPQIDQLMQIHQDYIFGSTSVDNLSRFSTPYSATYTSGYDNTTLIYQLSGGAAGEEVIVAINFAGEPLILDHGINMTNLAEGAIFHDRVGNDTNASTIIANGQIHVEIPARSYAVYTTGGNSCVANLELNGLPIDNGIYQVSNNITSAGRVDNTGNVIFKAGVDIDLKPGFEAVQGSTFCVEIEGCN